MFALTKISFRKRKDQEYQGRDQQRIHRTSVARRRVMKRPAGHGGGHGEHEHVCRNIGIALTPSTRAAQTEEPLDRTISGGLVSTASRYGTPPLSQCPTM